MSNIKTFSKKNSKKYINRLQNINNCSNKTVWDCIDKPIRSLVFEFNRIGFRTIFSCCGFPYENEEEEKSHICDKNGIYSYVMFNVLQNDIARINFINFINYLDKHQNEHKLYFQNENYMLKYSINNGKCEFFILPQNLTYKYKNSTNDNIPTIHDYEIIVVFSQNIAKFLQDTYKTAKDPIVIVDGNNTFSNYINWQVKPKPDFSITVDNYYKTFGKIEKIDYNFGNDIITNLNNLINK